MSLKRCVQFCTKYMSLGVVLAGFAGVFVPQLFQSLAPKIPWMLGIIMFGMGMSLSINDFKQVFHHPTAVLLGILFQFIIMPVAAMFFHCVLSYHHDCVIRVNRFRQCYYLGDS